MLSLYRAGRQADALECYRTGRRAMIYELGIEPGRALQDLEAAILGQDPALDPPARTTASSPGIVATDMPHVRGDSGVGGGRRGACRPLGRRRPASATGCRSRGGATTRRRRRRTAPPVTEQSSRPPRPGRSFRRQGAVWSLQG
jgi:hypothetical protein